MTLRRAPSAAALPCALRARPPQPGIPATDRARVGQRFLRVADPAAPQAPHGTGLGLAIAHAIAQRHGGSLRLEEAHPGLAAPGLRVGVEWPV